MTAATVRASVERGDPLAIDTDRILQRMRQDAESGWEDRLLDDMAAHPDGLNLSRREIDVLKCASRGLWGPMIAECLGISAHTVATHERNARLKLNAKNTTQAACNAIRQGLIP